MIYLLEDDGSIRDFVLYALNSQRMEARGFALPSDFWRAMAEELPALVLLDIMLPEEDGLSILRRLRSDAATAQLPIILLTAKDSEYDKVLGLDDGADDYVSKPFSILELLSRIRALLRRTAPPAPVPYHLGGLVVDETGHTVTVDGAAVALTQKEFELLCYLLRHPRQVLRRDQLLTDLWGYAFTGESRTVDVHIRTLRQKLGTAGAYIHTVRGYGYKLAEPAPREVPS